MAVWQDADLAALIAPLPHFAGAVIRPGPAATASPSYRGLDSHAVFYDLPNGESGFLKRLHPEMRDFYDAAAALTAAAAAGAAGIGPRALWQDAPSGALALEALEAGWRVATMADLQAPAFADAALAQIKRFHQLPLVLPRFDAFAQIDRLVAQAEAAGVALPEDLDWMRALLGLAQPALQSAPLLPCRNDGSSSNLMRGPEGAVRLVDFDRAGMNDPMYDLGVLLIEITDFDSDMQDAFVSYHGSWDAAAFARARLWAVVDDVLHMLQARISGQLSQRRHLEWLKYGEWRLMRARLALHHSQFEEYIRRAKGSL